MSLTLSSPLTHWPLTNHPHRPTTTTNGIEPYLFSEPKTVLGLCVNSSTAFAPQHQPKRNLISENSFSSSQTNTTHPPKTNTTHPPRLTRPIMPTLPEEETSLSPRLISFPHQLVSLNKRVYHASAESVILTATLGKP